MKMGLPLVITLVVCTVSLDNASAGAMSMPAPPSGSILLTVADQEMIVSNSSGYANLREKPSTSAKLVDKLPEGTKVIVIEKVSGGTWVHVKVGNKEGYIKTKLLK